jgi:hypothetical protein
MTNAPRNRWISISAGIAALSLVGLPSTSHADHTVFDYQIERLTQIGNHFASPSVENFDGENPAGCNWPNNGFGTTYHGGGICHLTSPGIHSILPGIPLVIDRSDIFAPGMSASILDGSGDATLEGVIAGIPASVGGLLLMQLDVVLADGSHELTSVSMTITDADLAPLLGDEFGGSYGVGLNP